MWSRLFLLNQRQSAVYFTHLLQSGLYKKSCPYIFHMLGGNLGVWKLVTEIRKMQCHLQPGQDCSLKYIPQQRWNFFFSYFFLFSGLKEMQEKILGRSSRKYVQDFQLGKRKNNNALHLGSTWRNLFTPKINLFLCPETILGFFFLYIFLPVHCSQFLNLKKYFETKVKIFLKKILTGIALAFPVLKYFICKSTSVWMFSKTTSFLDEIISWNGHRFINCLESLSELHISIST